MASVRHLEFEKFRFLSNSHPRNGNLHLRTKFDRNRHGWDMEIKPFSKWRPSAILNFRKLQFWSRDLYWYVILHLIAEFCVERPIRRRDIAKNDIQYGVRPPSWVWKMSNFFVKFRYPECKFASVYQTRSKSDNSRLIYGDKSKTDCSPCGFRGCTNGPLRFLAGCRTRWLN